MFSRNVFFYEKIRMAKNAIIINFLCRIYGVKMNLPDPHPSKTRNYFSVFCCNIVYRTYFSLLKNYTILTTYKHIGDRPAFKRYIEI